MSVDKLYKCSARYCPGLPFDPLERAHPVTCSEALRASGAVRAFVSGGKVQPIPPLGGGIVPLPEQRVQTGWLRVVGTSGQAEWPPSGDSERSYWPPLGTGPITDADVEAAAACVAGLMPWTTTYGNVSPAEAATLAERVAALMRERDWLRDTVANLTRERDDARAELNAAHESGLTPRRPTP